MSTLQLQIQLVKMPCNVSKQHHVQQPCGTVQFRKVLPLLFQKFSNACQQWEETSQNLSFVWAISHHYKEYGLHTLPPFPQEKDEIVCDLRLFRTTFITESSCNFFSHKDSWCMMQWIETSFQKSASFLIRHSFDNGMFSPVMNFFSALKQSTPLAVFISGNSVRISSFIMNCLPKRTNMTIWDTASDVCGLD